MLLPGTNIKDPCRGGILIYTAIIIFIVSLVLVSVLGNAVMQLRVLRSTISREQAFQIAEAGVNYYQWRLAHFPNDYANGTGQSCNPCGPYVNDYVDKDTNQKIGEYSLTITPPVVGSTVVTIQSTGYTMENTKSKRTITVRYGIPSLAKFAFLTNGDIWIGDTENVSGEMHANGGIRFDGTGNAPIKSAKQTYICQTTHGCGPTVRPGIWGAAPLATQAFWQFPMPNVDFSTMTANLATLKSSAQTGGIYLPPSNAQGYSFVFSSAGTMTIYRVNSLLPHATGYDVNGTAHNEDLDYNNRSVLSGYNNVALPANGLIYAEDKVWVEGTLKGRVMLAAAKLPYNANTAPSIMIPNNIVYAAKDGTNSLGLLAQKHILLSYNSPNNLEINAAMIAQNGSAQHFYWANRTKGTITVYGAVLSYGIWTWSWVNGSGTCTSGYCTTNTTYDTSLLYAPPPSFPLTTDGYQQISWTSN